MPSSDTQFEGKGVGTKHGESPISIRFSSKVRALLKEMPNAQDFVRQAVEEKLWIDSLPSVPIESKSQLPKASCVYMAIDGHGVIQYVGRSANLSVRWANHHKHDDLSKMEGVKIAYMTVSDVELLPVVEMALIEWFDPPLNSGFGGKPLKYGAPKTERKIRLTDGTWSNLQQIALEHSLTGRADLLEELARGTFVVVRTQEASTANLKERVEAAIAAALPTIPIKDRALANKAFKKLMAHLQEK